jgi:formylglycine-generating enzyme required for sulfatase activity
MKLPRGALARADLLRSLAALESLGAAETACVALAGSLHFVLADQTPVAPALKLSAAGAPPAVPDVALPAPAVLPGKTDAGTAGDASAPRLPLSPVWFDLIRVEPVAEPEPLPQALTAEQYRPRQSTPLVFSPLQAMPRLTRRMRAALTEAHAGRALDVAAAIGLLARGRAPVRWPRLVWPTPPAQVTLVVDRNLHLRPYWGDQNQVVQALAQWLGPGQITTFTVQGDPWQPLACWARGAAQRPVPALRTAAAGQTVLLLTDMGLLAQPPEGARQPARTPEPAARWLQALRVLAGSGARVLLCPPCSPALAPALPVAWFAQGQAGAAGKISPQSGQPSRLGASAGALASASAGAAGAASASANPLELLLTLLSCARRIEPELVRAMRRLLPQLAAEPGLEAQLWAASHCLEIGYDVCVWRADQVVWYRQQFELGPNQPGSPITPALQQQVLDTLLAVHAVRGRAIEMQEILVWASHVAQDTARPYQAKIDEAQAWLAALPQGVGSNGLDEAGLLDFACQTQAAQGGDEALTRRFYAAFGPLWGVACRAAERDNRPLPPSGGLPAERLAHWRQATAGPLRHWQVRQHGQQLLLVDGADAVGGAVGIPGTPNTPGTIGLPFASATLAIAQQAGAEAGFGAGRQVQAAAQAEYPIGPAAPELRYRLYTDNLLLELGEVQPPFVAAERGRDKYGLYADLHFVPPARAKGKAKPKGKKKQRTAAREAAGLAVAGSVVAMQKLRFRYIAPGIFLMGSPEDEAGRYDREGPQHPVVISHGFWLLDTTCTQSLWQTIMGENPSHFNGKGRSGGPNHPVENVSWLDVQQFLQKLSTVLGDAGLALLAPGCQITLPTEAEWEFACRAGSTTPWNFGTEINTGLVNYSGEFSWNYDNIVEDYRACTVDVVQFSANFWGLYQMHGNVWQWCADELRGFDETASEQPVLDPGLPVTLAPLAGGQQKSRALRGGSWRDAALLARSACRGGFAPVGRYGDLGFRFVMRSGSQVQPGV